MNDKFCFEIKKPNSPVVQKIKSAENFEKGYASLPEYKRLDLLDLLDENIPSLKPEHLINNLWSQQEIGIQLTFKINIFLLQI